MQNYQPFLRIYNRWYDWLRSIRIKQVCLTVRNNDIKLVSLGSNALIFAIFQCFIRTVRNMVRINDMLNKTGFGRLKLCVEQAHCSKWHE